MLFSQVLFGSPIICSTVLIHLCRVLLLTTAEVVVTLGMVCLKSLVSFFPLELATDCVHENIAKLLDFVVKNKLKT